MMARRLAPDFAWTLDAARLRWLVVTLVLVLAPHALRLPVWVSAAFVLLVVWRWALVDGRISRPSRWLLSAVGVALAIGVAISYRSVFGRGPGIALLTVLAGMKLLESRDRRDAYVIGGLAYFLVITNFLYSESIATGVYMFGVVTVVTATLISFTVQGHELAPVARLRLALTLLLQALPLMLVLFVLFPRISGSLWGLPKDARAARSGLSDTMSPGNITRLSLSDAIAFRVRFDGAVPSRSELYWRGPVLWNTDGRTWTAGKPRLNRRAVPLIKRGGATDYEVTLEPHQRRWLFALDLPGSIPRGAGMTDDYRLLAAEPVHDRIRYRVRSWTRATTAPVVAERPALRLPPGAHPRARALGARWRAESGSAAAMVARALAYFRNQPFHYTLTPPAISGDTVDGFLFESRRGFCEYYAASFAVLMRAAGIPTRIVTGYQGGEYNPLDGYLVVRQRDAHAWDEVWLGSRGWVRVDPTAAVAPARITGGMEAAIPPEIGAGVLQVRPNATLLRAWRRLRQGWDAVNNTWNQWVLGYGPARQRSLLARFGLEAHDYGRVALILALLIASLLAVVSLWLARRPPHADPAVRAYRRFCRKLARAGTARRAWEGPRDFAVRVQRRYPRVAPEVAAITNAYVSLRYADTAGDVAVLRRAVARFRVR